MFNVILCPTWHLERISCIWKVQKPICWRVVLKISNNTKKTLHRIILDKTNVRKILVNFISAKALYFMRLCFANKYAKIFFFYYNVLSFQLYATFVYVYAFMDERMCVFKCITLDSNHLDMLVFCIFIYSFSGVFHMFAFLYPS